MKRRFSMSSMASYRRLVLAMLAACLGAGAEAGAGAGVPVTRPPESVCPGVLTYDERDPVTARTRWTANIHIRPDRPLRGFTLTLELDKPAELLGNVVGPVTSRDNQRFQINTRKRLEAGVTSTVRIFVKHSSSVPRVNRIKLNGVHICPTEDGYFQTEPRRVVARPGEAVLLLGRVGSPLRFCRCHLPGRRLLDLSRGRNTTTPSGRVEYYGRGLAAGECGLKVRGVQEADDGLVRCEVMPLSEPARWLTAASVVRVTTLPLGSLPAFEISPRRKTVSAGDSLTVTCNTDRPLGLCRFLLPDERELVLDQGPGSPAGPDFHYHGLGLHRGHCGVTLAGVGPALHGFLQCRVGLVGAPPAWQGDALKLRVTDSDRRGRPNATTQATPTESYTPARTTPGDGVGSAECGRVTAGAGAGAEAPPPGQETWRGQWPWHAALYLSTGNGSLVYVCGGALVGGRGVVTAAHCVTSRPFGRPVEPATLVVHLGRFDLLQWVEPGRQHRQVERVVVHPSYNSTGLTNDLAVLVLRSEVNYTDYVRPVCLWDSTKTDLDEVEGREGTITGWGVDEEGQLTNRLTMAVMTVVSDITCLFSNPGLLHARNTTYCASFRNGTRVCNGDSGGGMVFPTRTSRGLRWSLRGLISSRVPRASEEPTSPGCEPRNFVMFTDLAQFLSWLSPYAVL